MTIGARLSVHTLSETCDPRSVAFYRVWPRSLEKIVSVTFLLFKCLVPGSSLGSTFRILETFLVQYAERMILQSTQLRVQSRTSL